MRNYKEDFKSLIIGQKYSVKNDPSIVFVFKSDPKIYDKYKEFIGKKEKKEKGNYKINAEDNVLNKNQFNEDEKNLKDKIENSKSIIKNNEIERNTYNPYGDNLKYNAEILVGELAVKPIVEKGLSVLDNEKAKHEFIEEKKIIDEEKKKIEDKLRQQNPMNNLEGKIEEDKKKIEDKLREQYPMNAIRDTKLPFEKDEFKNASANLIGVGEKATPLAKEGNPQDIKLNIDVEQEFNKIGDAINDGKRQALEQLEKEKEQIRSEFDKMKNQFSHLSSIPKNLNIKKILSLNNLFECTKKIFGTLNNPKELTERQKILANLKFIFNVFAELVCSRSKIG